MSAPVVDYRNRWWIIDHIAKYAINTAFNFTKSGSLINCNYQASETIKNRRKNRRSPCITRNSIKCS